MVENEWALKYGAKFYVIFKRLKLISEACKFLSFNESFQCFPSYICVILNVRVRL